MKLKMRSKLKQKQTLKKVSGVLLALFFLGILSYQISPDDGERISHQKETQLAEVLEESPQAEEIDLSEEAEAAEEIDALTATSNTLKNNSRVAKSQAVASPKALLKTSAAVNYEQLQMHPGEINGVLTWASSYQRNIKSFIIEKSIDDEIYQKIGQIEGLGKGEFYEQQTFQFEDEELRYVEMPRVFYRIKHLGIEGDSDYSDVMEFDLGLPEGLFAQVDINPGKDVEIHYAAYKSGPIEYQILDAFGDPVAGGKLEADFDAQSFIVKTDNTWSKGFYFLELKDEKYSLMQTFQIE